MMKDLYKYIKESAEDGKNGHWEDFVDEDMVKLLLCGLMTLLLKI